MKEMNRDMGSGSVFSRFLAVLFLSISMVTVVAENGFAADLGPMLSGYVPGPSTDSGWSVFVGGNFGVGGTAAELEGRAFVRGNFTASKSNYVIGRAGAGSGVYPPSGVPVLVVGGNMLGTGGINTPQFPPIQVGSNIAKTVSFIDKGAVITGGVDYATADALIADLRAKSQYWGSLSNTPGGTIVSQWGGLYITADGANGNPKTWVFNLTNDLTSAYWGVEFSGFEDGDSILVNCKKSGTNATFTLGVNSYSINGVNQKSAFGPKLLWNFPEAKTITINGYAAFQGSVLVGNPSSVTTVSVPGQDGRFATCGSLIHNDMGNWQGCEFHNYAFTGTMPEVPAYSIAGVVKVDADRTQSLTAPDAPLGNVTVALYTDPNGDGDLSDGVLVATAQTSDDGSYSFPSLVSGNYVVATLSNSGTVSGELQVALQGGSSTNNVFLTEVDPSGYFYNTENGSVVTGVTVSVTGRGAVVQMDGCSGQYMFISTNPAPTTYSLALSLPAGYVVDPSRAAASGAFDPTGYSSPVVMGSGLGTNGNYLADWSAASNTYYLAFVLENGDPAIVNNNIPLVKTVSVSNRVWEDLNGNGVREDGEPGLTNVTVRLLNASGAEVASTATDANGQYTFSGVIPGSYRISVVAPDGYLFTTQNAAGAAESVDSDVDASGASALVTLSGVAANAGVDAGLYLPSAVYGYVFVDKTSSRVYDTGDTPLAGSLVRLATRSGTVSTVTDSQGYYRFENVPAGAATVLVSRSSYKLVDVPTTEPAASDVMRNRGLPDSAGVDAYIALSVVSGYGTTTDLPGEPQNIGFASSSLSTALDFRAYASGNGTVTVDIWTVNESGCNDIVVYAWINNAWVEVARVSSDQVIGEGSNKYTVTATGLTADQSYYFRIVDESGHVHDSTEAVAVSTVRVSMVQFTMETAVLNFNTEYGCRYIVKVSENLAAGADAWTTEYASVQRGSEWSEYSNAPFMAGEGTTTTIRVPVNNRKQAFFKIVLIDD
jgi:choice-of-anchor A domain-containing protein